MNTELLDEILACQSLPSLPAIAVQVLELTSDQNVSMDELAELIQTDQAMAAKILRTVNSSFYALRERCTTIRKALVMLGLSPVKSLVLGFSLVNSIDMDEDTGFDYSAYWRRGLYTAAAAKSVADIAGQKETADECFLSGLLQDIGMIALLQTLGDRYLDIVRSTDGDHSKLVVAELDELEAQHPDIGATLAERWRLPEELTVPIKYHERPGAAPEEHQTISRAVAIGNMAHDALTNAEPAPALRKYYKACERWFGLSEADAESAFRRFAESVEELSDLFNLETGKSHDTDTLLQEAEASLIRIAEEEPHATARNDQLHTLLVGEELNDPLTGLLGAKGFAEALSSTFAAVAGTDEPITVTQVVIDGLDTVQERAGVLASDAVLIRAVVFLQQMFEPMGAIVCRVGSSIMSVIIPGSDSRQLAGEFEQFRVRFDASSAQILALSEISRSAIKVSVGLASTRPGVEGQMKTHDALLAAATKAVQAARTAGGDCTKTFAARSAA